MAPRKTPKKAPSKKKAAGKKAVSKKAAPPKPPTPQEPALDAVPGPTDVEAFKGGGDGFSGRATFRLLHFARALRLRDSSSTFRNRFAKADVLALIEREIRQGVLKANVIRRHLIGRSWQVGCTIKVKYHGSPRWDILTGFTPNYPMTREIRPDDFLRAYGHALSQTLGSPEEIRIISFQMLAWFRATAPQVRTLLGLNSKPVPALYDDDGTAEPRYKAMQREKRKANRVIIRTRFGI